MLKGYEVQKSKLQQQNFRINEVLSEKLSSIKWDLNYS